MKTIFLFFLLLNTAYFYFQMGEVGVLPDQAALKQPALSQGVVALTLVQERNVESAAAMQAISMSEAAIENDIAQAESEEEGEEQVSPELIASVCFSFGPFVQVDIGHRAVDAVEALGLIVERRQESQRTPKGYWVYLSPSKSYQAAKRKVTEMQKRGLKDLYIMGKGARKNAISLGLFKHKDAANDRFQQVKKLGLKPVLEVQYRESKQLWLDMSAVSGQVAVLTEVAEGFRPRASLSQRDCP